ncbi:PDDEXK nuclease domain-containing protein [Flavobacterium johnsoniae]|nr:PDDEXK nuclease domain-containing protein [Flavobacterium johnsoniae]
MVLYNQLIQCFVLIEIETYKPTRQNIGQLQMFVNYYERIKKTTTLP